jgi:hypothetical protein
MKIVEIGATKLNSSTNILTASCQDGSTELPDNDIFGSLGIVSRPYPSDSTGFAEGIYDEESGNIIASRDTRTGHVYGNLEIGDTCVHSTGPAQNARIFCKETKKIIALMVKDANDKDMGIIIDGENQKIQLIISGTTVLELATDQIVSAITDGTSNSTIILKPATIAISSGQTLIGPGPVYSPVLPAATTLAAPSVMLSTT